MKAIGVDIVETERIARSIDRFGNRFLRRIFTDRELTYCSGRVGSLAARWAAKEAVSKALGTGIGDVGWREIEVVNNDRLHPYVRLHGAAAALAARLDITHVEISLSHTREHAVAFAMAR